MKRYESRTVVGRQCPVCEPGIIPESRWRAGYRRCVDCRAKDPSKWAVREKPAPVVKLKPAPPPPPPTPASWWQGVPRADWQQAVEGHTFTASRKTLVLNHGGFGDSQL